MLKTIKLANGLTVLLTPIIGCKTTTALFMVATGSKYETRENNGISHFLEHVFFKGTTNRPDTLTLSSELDCLGGEYNAFTSKEYTGYWIKTEAKKINQGIEIVADMLINSKFDTEEINREKGVIIEELNMYRDNPMMYIEDLFEECLYGDTPAGWDTIGTKKTIRNFKREDFVSYLNSQYGASNSFLIIAGAIPKNIKTIVNKNFENISKQKPQPKLKTRDTQTKAKIKLHYKKTDQAHLSLGVRTFYSNHKDELTTKIIGLILGGSMSSRLFIELRERNGLAYYVHTNNECYTDTGYLTTRAGVPVDKLNDAIKIIKQEYQKIATNLVEAEELDKIKQFISGRIFLQLEGSDDVAEWYGRQMVTLKQQNRPLSQMVTPEQFLKELLAITPKDILKIAKKIFTEDQLNLAVIGPYKKVSL